jgi:hypothetical protein
MMGSKNTPCFFFRSFACWGEWRRDWIETCDRGPSFRHRNTINQSINRSIE